MKQLGIDFEIRTKDVEEVYPSELVPAAVPVYLSELKAKAFTRELAEGEVVLTADTIVLLGDAILEKPADEPAAIDMIRKLSGKTHQVITGCTLAGTSFRESFSETTEVQFRELEEQEIKYYVERFKPMDKAGAYAIQEWIGMVGIRRIDGCYYNVVGLPVSRTYEKLKLLK